MKMTKGLLLASASVMVLGFGATSAKAFDDVDWEWDKTVISTETIDITVVDEFDISGLVEINESDWNAVVLIHTTENSRPPADVKAYLDRAQNLNKVIVVTTSGSGDWKSDDHDVHVVTSASKTEELSDMVQHIIAMLQSIMHTVPGE